MSEDPWQLRRVSIEMTLEAFGSLSRSKVRAGSKSDCTGERAGECAECFVPDSDTHDATQNAEG